MRDGLLRFFAASMLVLSAFAPKAMAIEPSRYCYESVCFNSLEGAEAEMRSQYAYGQYMRREGTYVDDVNGIKRFSYRYTAPDRPPIYFSAPGYFVGGWGYEAIPGFCQESSGITGACADEAEAVQSFEAYFERTYSNCQFTNIRIEGEYGNPFVRSYASGNTGRLDFLTPEGRWLKHTIFCPEWDDPTPSPREYQLIKTQYYICPTGMWPIWGFNPPYNDSGNPDYIAIWPNLCTAGQNVAWIRGSVDTGISQTKSCPANENPCFPATGDKFRKEEDFEFGGKAFSRYYHSLKQVQLNNAVGTGWTHSYVEQIGLAGGISPYLLSEEGYYESFKKVGEGIYRGQRNYSDLLSRRPDGGWIRTTGDGERRIYGPTGMLQEVLSVTSSIHDITLSYDSVGRLAAATEKTGRQLKFIYDSYGKLISVNVDDDALAFYLYDASDNLTQVRYIDGTQRAYLYNESGAAPADRLNLLTGISENGTRYASFAYDTDGHVVSSSLEADRPVDTTAISYSSGIASVTKPLGSVYQYTLGDGSFKQVIAIAGPNGSDARSYSEEGRLLQFIDRNGTVNAFSYEDAPDGSASLTTIDAVGASSERKTILIRGENNLISERRVLQSGTPVSLIKYVYDSDGMQVFECRIDPSSAPALSYVCGSGATPPLGVRQSAFTYCTASDIAGAGSLCPFAGLLKQVNGTRDGTLDTIKYAYYGSDAPECSSVATLCIYRKGDLWKVTNALGQVTEYLSYDGAGRVLSIKDANGTITDYTYHPRGWLTASKVRGADDASESDDRITLIDYWPTGLVKQVTQPDGAFTVFTYDAAHRLTDIADNAGNTLHYMLDNAGNRVKEDTKDAAGTLKRTLSRVYNQLGQLATQATASGDPTDFGYDANGNTTGVTDALGHKTQNDYDPLNRLARTLQDVGGINAETKFSYDALDNLTKVTDPKGLDTTYAYNGLGDLTRLTSPDTGVTTYTYDSAGNRATQTDARNIKTTYSYDALNRLTKVAYPTTSLNVTYTYDVSQTTCASGETYAVGRLARMQDTTGTTDYCYDRFGDLVRKVQTTNGKVFVLRYAYTKAGQLSRLTYPDGAAVDYVRNAQGQTTEVGVTPAGGPRQVLLGNATYYPFGPVASWSYGNGRPMQRVLDQDYRPLAISDTRSDGLSTGFAFDPAGNLSALTAAGNTAPVVSLDYDALGRLTAFKDGPTGTVIDGYSYDATGNRLSAKVNTTTQSYTYPTTNHRLSAVAGTARAYDAIGNTLSIGGTAQEFAYDATGRMSQAKRAGTVVMKYGYNGRGEQVRRVDKTNTYTLYDESGHWLGNYDANGASLQQAIWLDDLPVGVLAKNSLRYVQPDHLGTPRAVIDPVRDVAIWKWDLKGEAFGNTPPDQDPDKDGTAFVFDMRFPGQRYDAATGFNQNYFRDYDPGTGRYGQSDPIGLEGGFSTYSYVEAAPFRYSDIFGLVKHTSGRWIDCGKGCRIRIDFTYDEKTGRKARHLHWECKGAEGECGEYGGESHGGTWDDAPKSIKECALRNGFSGQSVTNENYSPMVQSPEISAGAKAAIYVGGAVIIIFSALTGAGS
ncbi:RHS repeat-associated core domain-containing protein [Xanthomonas sp. SS]|uniref:RHS repeat-associated core domain-containing protein n=1 Tax=Xanthomonas sp. SS TaxID=2724122 RepID=UPI001639CE2F|nr:RHS repeat-associated core domain-containing protein [Xanthomonas sp. SS]